MELSRVRAPKRRYRFGEWQPWFAWRPVRVLIPGTGDAKHYAAYQWVWWEWLERADRVYVDLYYYEYRRPPA